MKILAIVSQKGGVGKTTVALNLSYSLAQRGHRVLLADLDPQGGIGHSVRGAEDAHRPGLVQLTMGLASLDEARLGTRLGSLSLLPRGELSPLATAAWTASLEDGQRLAAVAALAAASADLLIFDCPSGLGPATLGALRAASHALAPLQAEPLSLRSVPQLIEVVADLRAAGSSVALAGLVLTMVESRREGSLGIVREAWRLFPGELVLETAVPRDPAFFAASAEGGPVALLDRRPPAVASVFDQLAAELEPRLGLAHGPEDDRAIPLLG